MTTAAELLGYIMPSPMSRTLALEEAFKLNKTVMNIAQWVTWVINSLRPGNIMESGHHWFRWWPAASSVPRHSLNQCWLIINWNPREQTLVKLESKYNDFQPRKCIWKCCLQNAVHVILVSKCQCQSNSRHNIAVQQLNIYTQGPLLLTWINFNPSMDK